MLDALTARSVLLTNSGLSCLGTASVERLPSFRSNCGVRQRVISTQADSREWRLTGLQWLTEGSQVHYFRVVGKTGIHLNATLHHRAGCGAENR